MAREKSQTEILAEISLKLDTLLSLLAAKVPQSEQGELVEKLYAQGHSTSAIARIVGISENAVAIRLTRLRQKAAKTAGSKSHKKEKVIPGDQPSTEESPAG
jgi:DNA-directed RNA polymerase specialized sigma24 family protein